MIFNALITTKVTANFEMNADSNTITMYAQEVVFVKTANVNQDTQKCVKMVISVNLQEENLCL